MTRQFKVPGALLAALLLCLFLTASAPAYEWIIEEEDLGGLGSGKEKVTLAGGAFELKVPLLVTVKCTGVGGTGEITEGGKGKASLKLTGCSAAELKLCAVKSPGQSAGTVVLNTSTKFFAREASGIVTFYEELSPTGTIAFEGALCVLDEVEDTLTGTTAAEAPSTSEEPKKRPQKFSEAIAKSSGTSGLLFGKSAAYLAGEITSELSGEHAGQGPGVIPVSISPQSIAFTGTGEANLKLVTLTNISNVNKIKITDISIGAGPFTVTDFANPTCKDRKIAPGASCSVSVTCNTHPSDGLIVVAADELKADDTVIAANGRGKAMTC